MRKGTAHRGHRRGHHGRARGRERRQPHQAGPRGRERRQVVLRGPQRGQDPLRVGQQRRPGRGELHGPADPDRQRGADGPLQALHLIGDRRLGEARASGRRRSRSRCGRPPGAGAAAGGRASAIINRFLGTTQTSLFAFCRRCPLDSCPCPSSRAATSPPAAPGQPLVRLSHVGKHFGYFEALKDIDLDIARGEVVVVVGASGSGKSTLCRCINRLETINSGSITHRRRPAARGGHGARPAAGRRRHGVPVLQPLRPQDRPGERHPRPDAGPQAGPRRRPSDEARRCCDRVGVADKEDSYPASSPAASSSGSPSPARSRCSPR